MQTVNDVITLKEALLELVWPTRCVGCETPGKLLCPECQAKLKIIDTSTACPYCGAPYGRIICTECYGADGPEKFNFAQAVCALEFEDISARLAVLYKNGNEHRLAMFMAVQMLNVLPRSWLIWADCITWIPVDKKTLRRRGFDHMQVIADELARLTMLPELDLLCKNPVKDQRNLGRQLRRQNLEGGFSCKTIVPDNILLVDDVLTTGSTFDAASKALIDAGAKEVRVLAFTRVW
jgi:ComF family protein